MNDVQCACRMQCNFNYCFERSSEGMHTNLNKTVLLALLLLSRIILMFCSLFSPNHLCTS